LALLWIRAYVACLQGVITGLYIQEYKSTVALADYFAIYFADMYFYTLQGYTMLSRFYVSLDTAIRTRRRRNSRQGYCQYIF
jgi:hypothetical protein